MSYSKDGHESVSTISEISPQRSPGSVASRLSTISTTSSADSPYLDSNEPKSSQDGLPFADFVIENDELHDYESQSKVKRSFDARVILDLTTMAVVIAGIVTLFLGYPVIRFSGKSGLKKGGYNVGGTNASGQVPNMANMRFALIDPDTPQEALTKMSVDGSHQMQLVFSDEFNTDGRSFYPGDDPFWTAVDLWPWPTGDYEWYSPEAVTTSGGNLVITADQAQTNNLNFRSGQLTSWNQFCFTGGYIEARLQLPGSSSVSGWWPAVWTMGNLGRANYGATTQGTWPYAYSTCDRGTLRNQTDPDGLGPAGALTSGDTVFNNKYDTTSISWQPGQRLSACTCPGEDHPGPKDSSGNFVGRSAPEIDILEAQVGGGIGGVSQSGQWMPANYHYELINTTGTEYQFFQPTSQLNSYQGNVLQQSASGVTQTNQAAYQYSGGEFSIYGFEYQAGYDGYIHWISNNQRSWSLFSGALAADPRVGIDRRPVPQEPMYILLNLAISSGFGAIDWANLQFPGKMLIDYVRVYQPQGQVNIGCDPDDFPTQNYINKHIEAYTNPNLTIWGGTEAQGGYQQNWPRNRLYPNGCTNPPSKYPGPNPAATTS